MSLDTAMPAANASMFAALGVDASVVRGVAAAVTVRVVPIDSEETIGHHHQVTGNDRHLLFIKADWDPAPGDQVTIGAKVQTVGRKLKDDGYVAEVAIRG